MSATYFRNYILLVVTALAAVAAYNIWSAETLPPSLDYTSFLEKLDKGEVRSVHISGGRITGTDQLEQSFTTFAPDVNTLLPRLEKTQVAISASKEKTGSPFWYSTFPVLLLFGGWMFFMARQSRGSRDSFAKKKAIGGKSSKTGVTFANVAGIPEAKDSLEEIIDFLRDSGKYTRLGGRLPKGVLLQGPPGTGKTLLAKAIAGEAGVPFFSISGSDFVEMFVGVGASRVRSLFEEAKKNSPCIIFIDEIDAVGGHRASGAASSSGGHDERQQTLNALLVEMDGFQTGETVVIVAATNRPDVLDPALLRPGRFDRQVTILPPDVKGRLQILQVYARNIVMAENVRLEDIASATPGFTGADLANLMNESALLAARKDKVAVDLADIEEAKDKILMGAERKGMVISEEEKKTTAYHEAGHAILARLLPDTDPVHKISIIPRGRAMGMTQQVPIDDRHSYSREYLLNRIKILLGGRTAEEIVFNRFSTGASNDLSVATNIATKMVCEWGMSDHMGPRAYLRENDGFLGGGELQRLVYGDEMARMLDTEINKILEDCYQEAMIILEGKASYLHMLAEALLKHETITAEEMEIIITCTRLEKPQTVAGEHDEAMPAEGVA